MTIDNFWFYLQNRLVQTSQTGGQWYRDTSPFSIPWLFHTQIHIQVLRFSELSQTAKTQCLIGRVNDP